MKRAPNLMAILLTAAALTVQWTSQARAQGAPLTYVATAGSDANNCVTVASPCSTFPGALRKVRDGGTVQCLDAGYFGIAVISSSVTIDCLANGATANTQQLGIIAPEKTVVLRNIGINGLNVGIIPLDIRAAANVYIENALVVGSGFGSPGIKDTRAGPAKLVIRNSSIVNNGGVGILVAPASGVIGVELDNVNASYNTYGVAAGSGGRVMIRNSVFTGNNVGIGASPGSVIGISSSQISFNSTGVSASLSATVSLQTSSIDSNSTAISGPTESAGNNRIFANSANGTAPTIVGGQ